MSRVLLGLTFCAALLAIWGFLIEPNRLVLHQETLMLENWPPELDDLRVAVISDIHAGSPFVREAKLKQIVDRTNESNPDLILILGDLMVHGRLYRRVMDPEAIAAGLTGLHARLGVYAVLGNHDWWYNGLRVQRALAGADIAVIENGVKEVSVHGRALFLMGISDLWTRPQNIQGVYRMIPPHAPVIAFTHNPDVFPDIPPDIALTLAGHTHGGQVNIPFLGRPIVPSRYGQRYAAGLVREGGKQLFVTTGIGTSILPVRFRVPPEIAILNLKAK